MCVCVQFAWSCELHFCMCDWKGGEERRHILRQRLELLSPVLHLRIRRHLLHDHGASGECVSEQERFVRIVILISPSPSTRKCIGPAQQILTPPVWAVPAPPLAPLSLRYCSVTWG